MNVEIASQSLRLRWQNGNVRILGVSAASFKYNFRRRKARLQAQGRRRLVAKLRKKQARRITYENHRTSKAIVAYAHAHCRAIAIEGLDGVTADGSKIAGYTKKSQGPLANWKPPFGTRPALRTFPSSGWTRLTQARSARHE